MVLGLDRACHPGALKKLFQSNSVVTILGPRQAGRITLARQRCLHAGEHSFPLLDGIQNEWTLASAVC
jgi:predicted AAA+ superfamily ATPase